MISFGIFMTEFNAFYLNNLETLDIWGKFKDLGKHCPPPLFSPFVKDEQHQFSYNISSFIQYSTKMSLSNIKANRMANYTASQKHESTLLHKYVLNEFLTVDLSCKTKYFWKNSYRNWLLTQLLFFWHLLRPNW